MSIRSVAKFRDDFLVNHTLPVMAKPVDPQVSSFSGILTLVEEIRLEVVAKRSDPYRGVASSVDLEVTRR